MEVIDEIDGEHIEACGWYCWAKIRFGSEISNTEACQKAIDLGVQAPAAKEYRSELFAQALDATKQPSEEKNKHDEDSDSNPASDRQETKDVDQQKTRRKRSKVLSKADLIEELQSLRSDLGRAPTSQDIEKESAHSNQVFRERFGSIIKAREEAGVGQPDRISGVDDSELIDDLIRIHEEIGRPPTSRDIQTRGNHDFNTIVKHFGSVKNARREAGVGQPMPHGIELDKKVLERIDAKVNSHSTASKEMGIEGLDLAPDIVPKLSEDLGIPKESDVYEISMILAEIHGTTGDGSINGQPSSIAAASVYIACLLTEDHRSQREIADAAGLTSGAVRTNFRSILERYE